MDPRVKTHTDNPDSKIFWLVTNLNYYFLNDNLVKMVTIRLYVITRTVYLSRLIDLTLILNLPKSGESTFTYDLD